MPLIDRLRRRLERATSRNPGFDTTWVEGEAYAKEAFERIASSFVASWEIASAELYRVVRTSKSAEETSDLVNRFSDGLVPALEGLSATTHQISGLWRLSQPKPTQTSIKLDDLRAHLSSLPKRTEEGWSKSVSYIEQVFTTVGTSSSAVGVLTPIGVRIAEILESELHSLLTRLEELDPKQMHEKTLINLLLQFGDATCRGIEVELDAVRAYIHSLGN